MRPTNFRTTQNYRTRLLRQSQSQESSTSDEIVRTIQRNLEVVDKSSTDDEDGGLIATQESKSNIKCLIQELEELYVQSTSSGETDSSGGDEGGGVDDSIVSSTASTTGNERFVPLLGLYDVSYAQTKKGENPVGGKWTRKNTRLGALASQLITSRRTFQHLLPFNSTGCSTNTTTTNEAQSIFVSEAINIISFDALWKLLRLTVILRGDAIPLTDDERINTDNDNDEDGKDVGPLTNLAVRVVYDPPRIVFGRKGRLVNIQLGPSTDVLLDTTYVDDLVRVGKGGTSGTRFIFTRCPTPPSNHDDDDDVDDANNTSEVEEFRGLLARRPARKSRILTCLGSVVGMGLLSASKGFRITGGALAFVASFLLVGVVISTGGVETDSRSRFGRRRMREEGGTVETS